MKPLTVKKSILGIGLVAVAMSLAGCSKDTEKGVQQMLGTPSSQLAKAISPIANQVAKANENNVLESGQIGAYFILNCALHPAHYASEPKEGSGKKMCLKMYDEVAAKLSQSSRFSDVTGSAFLNPKVQQHLQSANFNWSFNEAN